MRWAVKKLSWQLNQATAVINNLFAIVCVVAAIAAATFASSKQPTSFHLDKETIRPTLVLRA